MVEQDLRSVIDRGLLAIGRGVLRLVIEKTGLQLVQVEALKGEVLDLVEHMQPYGLASHPIPGAEAVVVAVGGSRNHPLSIVIADRRHRPAVSPGDTKIHDNRLQIIHLHEDGITITTDKVVNVAAKEVRVVSGDLTRIDSRVVEIHGSEHVRIDAGGAGVTYWPSHTDDWRQGLPTSNHPPAPPEHSP